MKAKTVTRLRRELRREVRDALKGADFSELLAEALEPDLQAELETLDAFLTVKDDWLCVLVGWGERDACVVLPIEFDHDSFLFNYDDTAIIKAVDNILPKLAKLRAGAMAKLEERLKKYGGRGWCPPAHFEELRKRAPTVHPPLGFLEDDE